MGDNSKIEWCDSTFNPWLGCTKISPGCDHCYAERQMDQRLGRVQWGAGKQRIPTSVAYWRQPVQWNARADVFRECGACGWRGEVVVHDEPVAFACPSCDATDWRPARRRVFCASLADVFDSEAPAEWRFGLLNLIAGTPHLDWLVLTKRIGNAQRMLDDYIASDGHIGETWDRAWPNLWLGATVCNQQEADRDIPKLLQIPAARRFISAEPLLGPVDIARWLRPRQIGNPDGYGGDHAPGWTTDFSAVDWVIAGGESGPGARPCDVGWIRSLVEQCRASAAPCFVKQLGSNSTGWCPSARYDGETCAAWEASEGPRCPPGQCATRLIDRKGGEPAEWPTHLRVREFPRSAP